MGGEDVVPATWGVSVELRESAGRGDGKELEGAHSQEGVLCMCFLFVCFFFFQAEG